MHALKFKVCLAILDSQLRKRKDCSASCVYLASKRVVRSQTPNSVNAKTVVRVACSYLKVCSAIPALQLCKRKD